MQMTRTDIMLKVIFQNCVGHEHEIGTAVDKKGAFRIIDKFLEEHNFKSYYKRVWEENGRTKVDVGSWTEFFYTVESED